ncbi:hypothetical protein Bpfe_005527, partial [Biomphalaria pfeifferi]
ILILEALQSCRDIEEIYIDQMFQNIGCNIFPNISRCISENLAHLTISSDLIDDAILRSLAISSLRLFVEPTDIVYTSHEGWQYLRSNNVDMTLTLRLD